MSCTICFQLSINISRQPVAASERRFLDAKSRLHNAVIVSEDMLYFTTVFSIHLHEDSRVQGVTCSLNISASIGVSNQRYGLLELPFYMLLNILKRPAERRTSSWFTIESGCEGLHRLQKMVYIWDESPATEDRYSQYLQRPEHMVGKRPYPKDHCNQIAANKCYVACWQRCHEWHCCKIK